MNATALYERTTREVGELLRAVTADQWEARTPCAGWTVRDLVNHLVGENRWIPPLLAGSTVADVGGELDGDLLGADPVAAWDAARQGGRCRGVRDAISTASCTSVSATHPLGSTSPRWVPTTLSTTGISRWRSGAHDALEADLVAAVDGWFAGLESDYRQAGVIGPRPDLPADAGPQAEPACHVRPDAARPRPASGGRPLRRCLRRAGRRCRHGGDDARTASSNPPPRLTAFGMSAPLPYVPPGPNSSAPRRERSSAPRTASRAATGSSCTGATTGPGPAGPRAGRRHLPRTRRARRREGVLRQGLSAGGPPRPSCDVDGEHRAGRRLGPMLRVAPGEQFDSSPGLGVRRHRARARRRRHAPTTKPPSRRRSGRPTGRPLGGRGR